MNTTSLKPGIQKTINNISEIWFLLILAVPTIFDAIFEIGSKGKWTIPFILLSIAVILISILIKQLIQKTGKGAVSGKARGKRRRFDRCAQQYLF